MILKLISIRLQEPEIDSSSEEGQRPEKVEGNVEFVDVDFAYPARPEVQVKPISISSFLVALGQII